MSWKHTEDLAVSLARVQRLQPPQPVVKETHRDVRDCCRSTSLFASFASGIFSRPDLLSWKVTVIRDCCRNTSLSESLVSGTCNRPDLLSWKHTEMYVTAARIPHSQPRPVVIETNRDEQSISLTNPPYNGAHTKAKGLPLSRVQTKGSSSHQSCASGGDVTLDARSNPPYNGVYAKG